MQKPNSLDLSLNLDAGEREAICLARKIQAAAVLMDDHAGRRAAAQWGACNVGTHQAGGAAWLDRLATTRPKGTIPAHVRVFGAT